MSDNNSNDNTVNVIIHLSDDEDGISRDENHVINKNDLTLSEEIVIKDKLMSENNIYLSEEAMIKEKIKEKDEEVKPQKLTFLERLKKIKIDPVLIVAWLMAIISSFFTYPDEKYPSYIDWRSLGILWSLMVVIRGLRDNSVFEIVGKFLLKRVKYGWQLASVLIFMCFFGSMLITNDVALITFVPFAIIILKSSGREDMMILVVVFQTVAANMGSMLTPIGNPQNLYLYGITGMPIHEFILTMLPLTSLTFFLLILSIFILPKKKRAIIIDEYYTIVKKHENKFHITIYFILFIMAICSVLRLIPWYIAAGVILGIVLILDYHVILKVDYILLLTFIGFFIFTGNMGRIEKVKDILEDLINGKEFWIGLITSQFISNVPATLLLSEFANNYKNLLQGVNIGGLGTLIASMASLISYKLASNVYPKKKGKYLLIFTLVNIIYLIILCPFWYLLYQVILKENNNNLE
ncbi:hypothetical protein BCR32DRAFT_268550 [Anaeromyces robustus]|uniref:Citrate transporter-like domain-containing protein n=1 Tax=Anaeromyces robustus TaxID=1754192 RepID=A0A1Y1X568_9FUNG|nr:hypothetical protein BCR32DRAFT_268550 [Anaeromyces robustus]|eukprot:ORX80960.1 hypothetical protein BCR32DRAFT_268550 [Anaeromyces robustus]